MRRWALLGAVVAGVAACSDAETGKGGDAAVEAVQALPPGRPGIYQAAEQGPEPFVRALYAAYAAEGGLGEPLPPGRDPLYSRILNALIGEDFRRARGSVPTLNHDPVCNCQDGENLTLDSLVVSQTDAVNAEAAVVFTNAGQTHRQTLILLKEGPMWRVADVVVEGREPLSETLYRAIG